MWPVQRLCNCSADVQEAAVGLCYCVNAFFCRLVNRASRLVDGMLLCCVGSICQPGRLHSGIQKLHGTAEHTGSQHDVAQKRQLDNGILVTGTMSLQRCSWSYPAQHWVAP